MIRSKSEICKAPFSIEKIANRVRSGNVVKSIVNKYIDPLIKRRSIFYPQKIVKEKENSTFSNPLQPLHYLSLKLIKANPSKELSKEDFPFSPKLSSLQYPKQRPYMLLLSKAKKSANIRNSMFNDLSFSKDVKINSIISQGRSFSLPDINESKITISQDNSLVMCNMKEKALHKSKMSRIEQIAELSKLFANNSKENSLFNKKESFSFVTNRGINKDCLSNRNKQILLENNSVTIDCIKSRADVNIIPEQLISPYALKHRTINVDSSDRTYKRLICLDGKLKSVIKQSRKYSYVM